MTTIYHATIQHHSISRAREIEVAGTLTQAKRAASREFRDENLDYDIVIYEGAPVYDYPVEAARRRAGSRHWHSY